MEFDEQKDAKENGEKEGRGKKTSVETTRSNNPTRFQPLIAGVSEQDCERSSVISLPDPNMITLDASEIIDEIQSLRYRDFVESAQRQEVGGVGAPPSRRIASPWISRICSQCSSYLKPYDVEA